MGGSLHDAINVFEHIATRAGGNADLYIELASIAPGGLTAEHVAQAESLSRSRFPPTSNAAGRPLYEVVTRVRAVQFEHARVALIIEERH